MNQDWWREIPGVAGIVIVVGIMSWLVDRVSRNKRDDE